MLGIVPFLLRGALISIGLSAVGLAMGLLLGIPTALLKTYGRGIPRAVAVLYTEIFRGTPLLLQLFIIYFGLPDAGIVLDRFTAACLALGLNSGAYQAEYFRGALQSIDAGQITAARAIGMTQTQCMRHVLLPQLLRIVLPAWSNEAVYIVKYAAVAFTIAVPDLLARGKMLVSWHWRPIEVFLTVAALYIAILGTLAHVMERVEKRVRIPGLLLEAGRER